MKNIIFRTIGFVAFVTIFTSFVTAAPVVVSGAGANPADLQPTVNQFRALLGGANNGVGGSFTTGRREINWDGVPDNFASPNALPVDFFNVNSPRGAVFNAHNGVLRVSAALGSGSPVRFGDVDASYPGIFQTFSAERLFAAVSNPGDPRNHAIEITFYIPGTKIPATVSGFGAVFSDVNADGGAVIRYFGIDGKELTVRTVPGQDNGLSFTGVTFNAGERIARVRIESGKRVLGANNTDAANDIVAMDDFIYGEPRAAEYHPGDFDGDGTADSAVFRQSTGTFFLLNSGSGTVSIVPFGTAGDIPINGDFDGDSRADVGIYRPSSGQWWIQRSTAGLTVSQFGSAGDKPTPGDFDKDGLTDVAFWRPSTGNYFVLTSSSNFTNFFSYQWGQNGDLPVGALIAP